MFSTKKHVHKGYRLEIPWRKGCASSCPMTHARQVSWHWRVRPLNFYCSSYRYGGATKAEHCSCFVKDHFPEKGIMVTSYLALGQVRRFGHIAVPDK